VRVLLSVAAIVIKHFNVKKTLRLLQIFFISISEEELEQFLRT